MLFSNFFFWKKRITRLEPQYWSRKITIRTNFRFHHSIAIRTSRVAFHRSIVQLIFLMSRCSNQVHGWRNWYVGSVYKYLQFFMPPRWIELLSFTYFRFVFIYFYLLLSPLLFSGNCRLDSSYFFIRNALGKVRNRLKPLQVE